jgi:WD40 repeat protein/tRNA A-37 threonylcarbamoyl transferase component Bud32
MGRGGMGVVFLARHQKLKKFVALKLIRKDRLEHLNPEQRRRWMTRFCTEAKAAARIDHERVVTVYEVGAHGGNPFYSMRYVEGHSLADKIKDGPLPNRQAAELMEQVARAVQAIHDHKVLHRDLKPHNILVDAKGRPFVTDFGLAKCADAEESLTHTGEMLGSAAYMSPEQAQDSAKVTEATDVYGLGATLYALLTGRPPFAGKSLAETLDQVKNREPVPPCKLNPAVDRDLNTIALACLEKEPGRRYRSAGELADEMQRYLEGRPIARRPLGLAGRVWRWCRRKPALATISAAALLLMTLAGGLYLDNRIQTNRRQTAEVNEELAQKRRQQAVEGQQEAEKGQQKAVGELTGAKVERDEAKEEREKQTKLKLQAEYPDDMRKAGEAWDAKSYGRVHEVLKKHLPVPGRDDHRLWEWHYLKAHTPSPEPSGKNAALPRTFTADATRDAVTGMQEYKVPSLLTWIGDVPRLSILNPDGEFFVWHADTQAQTRFSLKLPTEAVIWEHAVWAPNGQRVASRSPDGTHYVWDVVTGERQLTLSEHTGSKFPMGSILNEGTLTWNATGERLAALSQDSQVTIWDTQTGKPVFTEGAPNRNRDWPQAMMGEQRSGLTWSPDGKRLAFWRLQLLGSKDPPGLVLVDGTTGKVIPVPSKPFEQPPPPGIIGGGFQGIPARPVWSPDGKLLACFLEPKFPYGTGLVLADRMEEMRKRENAKFAGTIVVVNSQTGESVHRATGLSPSWSPDGKYLVFQRVEGDCVLDIETKTEIKHPIGRVLAWGRDGKRMALFTGEASWQMTLGMPLRPGEVQVPKELHLRDGELHIFDVAAGKSEYVLRLGDPRRSKPKPKQEGGGGKIGAPPGGGQAKMPPGQGMPIVQGVPGGLVAPGGNLFQPSTVTTWVVERWCPDLKWVALEKCESTVRPDPITGKEELMPRSPYSPPLMAMPPAKKNEKPKRSDNAGLPPGFPPPPGGGTPSVAEVCNLTTKEKPLRLPALWLTWSPDNQRVVLDNGQVWNLAARKKILTIRELANAPALGGAFPPSPASETKTFIWSPDGKWLLVGYSSSMANRATPRWQVYDTSKWKVSGSVPRNALVRFSPNSQRLLAGGRVGEPATGQFCVFEIPTLKEKSFGASPEAANLVAAAWSPEGKRIATGSGQGIVRVWDAGTGAPRLRFECQIGVPVVAVAWSKDGRLFAADEAGNVKAWDTATQKEVFAWKVDIPKSQVPFPRVALKLQFSPHASRLAQEEPQSVRVWDAATGKPLSVLGAGGHILAWSPDENALVMRENRKEAAFDPDQFFKQNQAAKPANSDFTRTWNVITGKVIATFYKPEDSVTPVGAAWSPDGRLAFCYGTVIKIHDAVSGQEILTLQHHARALAWSQDGWRLSAQFTVKLAEWPTPRQTVIIWNATPEEIERKRQAAEPANAAQDDESTAVAALEKLGARVERDEKQPGKPVMEVRLIGAKQVKDADLKHLKFFASLQRLYLADNQVTDAGLENIKDLRSLQVLQLSQMQITDEGLKHLKELKNLWALTLWDVRVTDAGLKELKGLQRLSVLSLPNTKVTDAGVKDLKNALPKCEIRR